MTTKGLVSKRAKENPKRVFVVATNSDYGKLCVNSLKRLLSRQNVEVLSFATMDEVTLPKPRPQSTLVVSRLSDISKKVAEIASAGASTKQLVFLEGLPVEAVAARLFPLNIRNPERIHIAAQRDRASISELVYRLVSGMAEADGSHPIVDAWIENKQLVLLSPSFARLDVPLEKLGRFIGSDKSKAGEFEIDEDGRFLHWPHADVHLGWAQFQQIVDPSSVVAQAEKTEQFNKRYGAAIRSLREELGLKQSDVHGITDRQLRRVEHGEQAVSKGTLEALAKAASLSLEDYLNQLAKRV